jgi:serine O-acetyltransferase
MPGPRIAPTAQIDSSARIAPDAAVGHFTVIGAGVELGAGCRVGNHVVIHADSVVGHQVRIDDHAVLGKLPMRAARSTMTTDGPLAPARVDDDCIIGTGAILYRGCAIGRRVLVADYATVRERVLVGAETIVGRGVAIESDTTVGARCKLETNAYLTAFTTVEDDVFIAPGVLTSNDNFMGRTEERKKHFAGARIRRGARLGVGAVVLPGREVPEEAVVAAGAVLTRDAEAAQVHLGVPARPVRPVSSEQLLPRDSTP